MNLPCVVKAGNRARTNLDKTVGIIPITREDGPRFYFVNYRHDISAIWRPAVKVVFIKCQNGGAFLDGLHAFPLSIVVLLRQTRASERNGTDYV